MTMSGNVLDWILWLTSIILLLILFLILFAMLMRWQSAQAIKLQRRVRAVWQPVLFESLMQEVAADQLPPLKPTWVPAFAQLWCSLLETVAGNAETRLRQLGRQLELTDRVQPLLKHPRFSYRLLAVTTLGHVGGVRASQTLQYVIDTTDSPILALAGLQALMSIDEKAGWYWLFVGRNRHFWAAERLVDIARKVDSARSLTQLKRAFKEQDKAHLPFILELMTGLRLQLDNDHLKALATEHADAPEVLSRLLLMARSPALRPWVRDQLSHDDVRVRIQGARAMQVLGKADDLEVMVPQLTDADWWVRYRTMQAILKLPGVERSDVAAAVSALNDTFAQDIFAHVDEEQSWAFRGSHGYLVH